MSDEAGADILIAIFISVMLASMAVTSGITPELKAQFELLCHIVAFILILGAINLVICRGALNWLGIRPRQLSGLFGIISAPFLHADWGHLIGNMMILFPLGWLVMLGNPDEFLIITIFVTIVGGFSVWLFCPDIFYPYVGASGVIFGYLGFLLIHGYLESNSISVIISALVGGFYLRKLKLALPRWSYSWQGHLWYLIAGVLSAYQLDTLKVFLPVS